MNPHTIMAELVATDGTMIRFFWSAAPGMEDVGIHSYSKAGETICSEASDRESARHRWSQLIRAGYKLQTDPRRGVTQ